MDGLRNSSVTVIDTKVTLLMDSNTDRELTPLLTGMRIEAKTILAAG